MRWWIFLYLKFYYFKVLSCGLNENFVLGQNTPHKKIFAPKRIDIHIRIEKICTSRYHSAFYFRNCLYVCGTNYGQMGMDTPCGSSIVIPKVVRYFRKSTGYYVLHGFQVSLGRAKLQFKVVSEIWVYFIIKPVFFWV